MNYYIECNNPMILDGFSMVSFPLIGHLPYKVRGRWLEQVQRFARRYSSPTPIYAARRIASLWIAENERNPQQFPILPTSTNEAHILLKNLRRACYERLASGRLSLSLASNQWLAMTALLKHLSQQKLFPNVEWESGAYKSFPNRDPGNVREDVRSKLLTDSRMIPKKLNISQDVFHTDLLMPLSLHLDTAEYLEKYEKDLGGALELFWTAAKKECEELQLKSELGEVFYEKLPHSSKLATETFISIANQKKERFIDVGELSALPAIAEHLLVIKNEMNGFPTPYLSYRKRTGVPLKEARALAAFGKDKILPYMGFLNTRNAVPIIVLILLENPRINVSSLLLAKVINRDGQEILISSAGELEDIRISVNKPRAGRQMHSILSEDAVRFLLLALRWTEPIRNRLLAEGRCEEAQFLWIGFVQPSTHTLGRLSINNLRSGFKVCTARKIKKQELYKKNNNKPRPTRSQPSFIERHPSLNQWDRTATLQGLRVSAGVYKWFQSKGDIDVAARAFGHKDIKTTLGHYIPQPLQASMYEQQIRRWQNVVICAASADKNYLLEVTDFSTLEELHLFISSFFRDGIENVLSDPIIKRLSMVFSSNRNFGQDEKSKEYSGKVVMPNNPDRLAILLLYREHILEAFPSVLDIPDSLTNTPPRLWLDLANALLAPMPDAYRSFDQLIELAKVKVDQIRNIVKFPKWIY